MLRSRPLVSALFALLVGLAASAAHARGYRIDQVPGGWEFECYMCHYERPFTRLTVFGVDARRHLLFREDYPPDTPVDFFVGEEGNVDWAALALLDSDGDGYTNGEELGDPLGLFRARDRHPDFPFTRPDLPDEFPCGSGTVEGPEECDGAAFDGATCADFGLPGGALACRADCTIDPSGCTPCGDGVLDPGEECDGPIDAVCDAGLLGEVRCVECRIDRSDCRPMVDAALPDAEPPDAGPPDGDLSDRDASGGDLPDGDRPDAEAVDASPIDAGPADARLEADGMSSLDAMPSLDAMDDIDPTRDDMDGIDPAGDAAPAPPDPDAAPAAPAADAPHPDCRLDPGAPSDGAPWPLLLVALGLGRLLLARRR